MSLILDALNKAENERDPEGTPTLNSNHDQPYSALAPEKDQRPLYIAGAVGGVLVLIFIIWLFSGEKNETQKQPQVSNALSSAPSNLAPQAATPQVSSQNQQATQSYATPAPTFSSPAPVKTTAHKPQQKTIAQQYERAANTPGNAVSSAKNKSQIEAIYSQPEETIAPKVAPTPKPTPKPKAKPKLPSLADYGTLSFIGDLPYSKQKNIPTLMYTDHRYQRGSARVTINKVDRKIGDQIASGLVLEDIVEDGIVLNFQSKLRFKMVAFNSWINM